MSLKIPLNKLKDEDIESFEKHLVIEEQSKQIIKKKQKCPWIMIPKFNIIRRDEHNVFIPFNWGMNYFSKIYRTKREDCCPAKITFQGQLRDEQNQILKESIDLLNNNGSCLIAVYPGGGKCLAKGTRILLYNGDFINVENVKTGDLLIGDDYKTRIVQSICKGQEKLYTIYDYQNNFINYTCNESHILTLWDTEFLKIIDLSLKEFLLLNKNIRKKYKSIYMDFDSENFSLRQKRIFYKNNSTKYSNIFYIDVKNNFEDIIREIMLSGFLINSLTNNNRIFFEDPHNVFTFLDKRVVNYFDFYIQEKEIDEYFGFELDQNGRFLLWNGIITHNTITSLAISSKIGLRTMILVNKIVLIDQWIETIKKVFGEHARIQHLKSKSKITPGCQFYIMNAINVAKRNYDEYQKLGIGFLIIDECHLIMTKIFSKALGYICPRYLLGLSATPFRPDGFDSLLNLYFGLRKVVRKLFKPHKVYFLETNIKIVPKNDAKGELIWNTVIDQQTLNEKRNEIIIKLCKHYSDRNILILSKRIAQIQYLHENLINRNENATLFKDSENTFDKDARILIATFQKVGTGFSHDKLDMLILATDAEEYFMQYLGRVFRRPDVEPIIIDIIDDNPILKRHFLSRRKIYQECGGTLFKLENF